MQTFIPTSAGSVNDRLPSSHINTQSFLLLHPTSEPSPLNKTYLLNQDTSSLMQPANIAYTSAHDQPTSVLTHPPHIHSPVSPPASHSTPNQHSSRRNRRQNTTNRSTKKGSKRRRDSSRRTANAYILFRSQYVEQNELSDQIVYGSKMSGIAWGTMSKAEKEKWRIKALELKLARQREILLAQEKHLEERCAVYGTFGGGGDAMDTTEIGPGSPPTISSAMDGNNTHAPVPVCTPSLPQDILISHEALPVLPSSSVSSADTFQPDDYMDVLRLIEQTDAWNLESTWPQQPTRQDMDIWESNSAMVNVGIDVPAQNDLIGQNIVMDKSDTFSQDEMNLYMDGLNELTKWFWPTGTQS
ncbi:hypothetical protein VNI00_002501 [Paramarasmius palmivorus]|uniref:HMG box domain-containing protein n=1 Tax=Paramarasmius palmivorus TaxID=297713 RepID=A0AAW0DV88_9AGAR